MKDHELSHVEMLQPNQSGREISLSHREFLLARHGTLELVPLPAESLRDPLNWPTWQKNVNLSLVSFHAMMCLFIGAGIIPAYENMAEEMNVSLQSASYFTSMQIVVLGSESVNRIVEFVVAPLVWRPISMRLGLRTVWLLSTLCSSICNIGCARSKGYGAMAISRVLVAFFISPAMALGTQVVTQMFFEHERGQKMGIWTLMVTLGPPLGPFLMGFVTYHAGWRWIFWIFAIVNIVQCALYFILSPETNLPDARSRQRDDSSFREKYLCFRQVSKRPIKLVDFITPLISARHHVIWIVTVAYAQIFNLAFVLLTVEVPQIFGKKFHLNTQQIGLQFLGMIIGGILGEQAAGPLGDFMMRSFLKRHNGQRAQPEFRLWLSYLGYATVIAGFLVWGFQTADLPPNKYDVSPIVGIGISSFGAQIITTSVFTYMVDSYPSESAEIGIFANVIRQIWGFIGPFWFPSMFDSAGIKGSAGIMVGICVIASLLPIIGVQIFGARIRKQQSLDHEINGSPEGQP
ncbi:hypothetical protein N7454_002966 [Penicillium verhagenii]|nr:hypothetical protein N7454_002966 [Penicillium verhagenii]